MNNTTTNPEFVKRMVVDAENMTAIRKKFFNGETLTADEIAGVIALTPHHPEVTWGNDRISMVPWTSLEHLDKCVRDTVSKNVPGDFVETGAWRGGSCIIVKSIYNELRSDKKVFVVDSFEGLPKPDKDKYPDDKNDTHYLDPNMTASLEMVKGNFQKFNCLDDKVIFIKGWFKDTLPTAPIEKISILRLDGDMYESTIDVLKNLYHKLSIGGYCIIDDYHHPACRAAVQDFRARNGIIEPIMKVDTDPRNEVHYWIKQTVTTYNDQKYPMTKLARKVHSVKNKLFN